MPLMEELYSTFNNLGGIIMKKIFLAIVLIGMGLMFTSCDEPAVAVLEDEGIENIIVEEIIIE